MNIVYLKLYNGDDVLGKNLSSDDEDHYKIESPLQVKVHPTHGMFAKSWLLLSVENTVVLSKKDVLFIGEANERARLYYTTFLDKLTEAATETEQDEEDDVGTYVLAMLEAETSTKH